jgi:hypothetical protein
MISLLHYFSIFVITSVANTAYLSCGRIDYPKAPQDCTAKSTSIRSCCYAEYLDKSSQPLCIDFDSRKTGTTVDGNIKYTCPGVSDTPSITMALFCGPKNPISVTSCTDVSDEYNSCCYMTYKGDNYCINLGRKYQTKIELDGDYIECGGVYVRPFAAALFLVINILFF